MMTKIMLIVFAILISTTSVSAQIYDVKINGYLMMSAPVNPGEYFINRWSVINMTGSKEGLDFRIQYDLANMNLTTARVKLSDSVIGGLVNLNFGRIYVAAGQITPAPNKLKTPLWYEVYNQFTIVDDGLCVSYERGKFAMYLATGDKISASAKLSGLALLWQQGIGGTATFEAELNWLFNPFIGGTWYKTDDYQYSVSNYSELFKGVKAIQTVEYGQVAEWNIGVCWDPNEQIRLIGNYATHAEDFFLEVVCTF